MKNRFSVDSLSPTQMIVFSFLFIIVLGTMLLHLPWASRGEPLTFVDALFTSVSATCVTGLTVVDVGNELSFFGQLVVLILIQLGGLGIMTFSTFFIYLLGRKITIRGREVIDSTLSYTPVSNIGSLLWKIMVIVFSVEALGGILLTLFWLKYYPLPKAIYHGLFHAVSAFCNAGFSLYSNSFEGFQNDVWFNLVIISLIVIGGLGFVVLLDLKKFIRPKDGGVRILSFHSKVVLSAVVILILFGTLFIFFVERSNTLKDLLPFHRLQAALFQSVTARTAGFNTISIGSLTNSTCFILMFLMFFGAAPGSCGGGVKVSTLGILAAMFYARLRGYEEPQIFNRSIPKEAVGKVVAIVLSSVLVIGVIFLGLLLTENWSLSPDSSRGNFIELFFESVSAFGTVGLSMGATSKLTTVGRVLIIVMMFVGRLGPLTLAVALTRRKPKGRLRYARGEIMVG